MSNIIVKKLKISVEEGRVATTLNILFSVVVQLRRFKCVSPCVVVMKLALSDCIILFLRSNLFHFVPKNENMKT